MIHGERAAQDGRRDDGSYHTLHARQHPHVRCFPRSLSASRRRSLVPSIICGTLRNASRASLCVYPKARIALNASSSPRRACAPSSSPSPILSLSSRTIFSAVFLPMPETLVRYVVLPCEMAERREATDATSRIASADFGPMPDTVSKSSKTRSSLSSANPYRSSAFSRTARYVQSDAFFSGRSPASVSFVAETLYPTPPAFTITNPARTACTSPSRCPIMRISYLIVYFLRRRGKSCSIA